jgi:hypothetical protein
MSARRLPWLLAALAVTAVWSAIGGQAEHDPALSAAALDGLATERLPTIRALIERQASPDAVLDPFALSAPASPAPPPPQGAVPPAPTFEPPPPLAWRYIGKQQDDESVWTVFLAHGPRTQIVRVGDTLDDTYRVAAIAPPTLTLQHLKNKTNRTLDIGAARE